MYNILYIDSTGAHQNETLRILRKDLHDEKVENVLGASEALNLLKSKIMRMVILDCKDFMVNELSFIMALEDLGYRVPILVLSYESEFVKLVEDRRKTGAHFTMKPIDPMQIVDLTRKLMLRQRLPRRVNKRYLTNELATLEKLAGGKDIDMKVFNLSMGGAYCECGMGSQVAVGDLVRLNVDLTESQNRHVLNAKVVWRTSKDYAFGKQGVGLQFIRQKEI